MECLVLIYDAANAFVVDLAASITAYGIRPLDGDELGRGQNHNGSPFIVAIERDSYPSLLTTLDRLETSGTRFMKVNLSTLDSFAASRNNTGAKVSGYDHEYLFPAGRFSRKDFCRFLALITGQHDPLAKIKSKERSAYIGLTYPNIRVALSNMPIVSVGADALELRIDLLRDESQEGDIPTLDYVAEQLVALRLQTELPIIFTIRLTPSGGRWPLDRKKLAIEYLQAALSWGVDFVDVEDLLEEELRGPLVALKGCTRVIASHHDFSGRLDWSSLETHRVYEACASYGDVVLMAGLSTSLSDAFKLQQFRSKVDSLEVSKPIAAFDTGRGGKLSRILNPFLQATTHHLLPTSSAPDQLSLVESNGVLSVLGELIPMTVYDFQGRDSDAVLMDKCFNELNLPHRAVHSGEASKPLVESLLQDSSCAGGILNLASESSTSLHFSSKSPEALATGLVDTVVARNGELTGHNCHALGMKAVLLQDHTPSAFNGQEVLVISHSYTEASTITSVLLSLQCGKIHTLGFAVPPGLSDRISNSIIKSMDGSFSPVGIFCTLSNQERSFLAPLLSVISKKRREAKTKPMLYLDTQASVKDPAVAVARAAGWCTVTREHILAAVLVERLRVLVDQSVPYSFVRMVRRQQLS